MNKENGGEAKDRLHCLSDETWSLIEAGFPHAVGGKEVAQKCKSREVLEAVLYRARTGCPWRDLPKAYGPWHTIYMRWQRWVIDGVLNRAWGVLKEIAARWRQTGFLDGFPRFDSAAGAAARCWSSKKMAHKPWGVQREGSPAKYTSLVLMSTMSWSFD